MFWVLTGLIEHVALSLTQNYLVWVIDTGYGFRGGAQKHGTRDTHLLLATGSCELLFFTH